MVFFCLLYYLSFAITTTLRLSLPPTSSLSLSSSYKLLLLHYGVSFLVCFTSVIDYGTGGLYLSYLLLPNAFSRWMIQYVEIFLPTEWNPRSVAGYLYSWAMIGNRTYTPGWLPAMHDGACFRFLGVPAALSFKAICIA